LALGRDELRKQNSVKLLARFNFDRIKCNQAHASQQEKRKNQSISGHVVVKLDVGFSWGASFSLFARIDV
jgi:hypothetical protein